MMKYLHEAMRRVETIPSRVVTLLLAILGGTLLPTMSFAGEKDVVLKFTGSDQTMLYGSLAVGALAIVAAFMMRASILKLSPGGEKMQEVGRAIKEGALAYLVQQVKLMAVFVVLLAVGLFFLFDKSIFVPITFIAGVMASYIAGYTGMLTAVDGNMRTASAALTSYGKALTTAFRSGAVAGMMTVGMGLIGATLILLFGGDKSMTLLVGFGFGGSLAALFMRVGGGIFTKAADVGADLVGKVEAGIPEDDPRNPATIADNVGDNVGDCAGMAADIFESYEVTLVAAIVLGAATASIFDQATWMRLILFALMARGVGIVASFVGIILVKGSDDIDSDPLKAIRKGFYASAAIALVATFGLAYLMMGGQGAKIKTTELIRPMDVQETGRARVVAVRDRLARAKGYLPADNWKVPAKDVAAEPELADVLLPSNLENSGMTPEQQKAQEVQRLLSDVEQREENYQVAPERLRGFTPLAEVTAKNPALNYAINKIAKSVAELKATNPADDPLTTVKEARDAGLLDLVFVKVERDASPAAPGQPPSEKSSFYAGPFNKFLAEDYKKNPPAPTVKITDVIPATVYANSEGRIVVAANLTEKDLATFQAVGQFTTYYKASKEDVTTSDKLRKDPKTAETAAQPIRKPVWVAFIKSIEVPWYLFAIAISFGIFMAFAIEFLTDYYVSTHKKPTQEVAGVSNAGAAPMIIQGFAYAMESSVFMVFAIVIALLFPLFIFAPAMYGGYILSFYGIALVGLGLLTTTGYVLAMDTFGPISDNAQGVFEMSGEGHGNVYGGKAVQRLDAAGNTTKALTKGFAIATAVVAAVALFHSYLEDAHLSALGLRLEMPEIFLGLLIGAAAPYLFSAFAINAVGRASFQLINEVRRQFRNDPGILAGTSKPDYGVCVAIVTAAAQKELLGPGILAIALPVAVAFGFSIGKAPVSINGELFNLTGAQALGGFLVGAIASGQLLAVLLANSGGMWDNAKKLIEDGLYGGKGTEAHKAGVVCDTVGDPFKDTAGPALNPLIKVMNLVALLLAPVIVMPLQTGVLVTITLIAVGLLAIAIYVSKKGSLSSEMQKVTKEAEALALSDAASVADLKTPAKPAKKRITVEDDEPETPKSE